MASISWLLGLRILNRAAFHRLNVQCLNRSSNHTKDMLHIELIVLNCKLTLMKTLRVIHSWLQRFSYLIVMQISMWSDFKCNFFKCNLQAHCYTVVEVPNYVIKKLQETRSRTHRIVCFLLNYLRVFTIFSLTGINNHQYITRERDT